MRHTGIVFTDITLLCIIIITFIQGNLFCWIDIFSNLESRIGVVFTLIIVAFISIAISGITYENTKPTDKEWLDTYVDKRKAFWNTIPNLFKKEVE